MRTRIALTVVATAAFFGLVAGTARAALFLVFDRTRAHAGEVIHAQTGGQGVLPADHPDLPLFLVPARQADSVTAKTDPALIDLGVLVVDGQGNGKAAFEVPDVLPGRYLVMVHCESCAATSAGRTMLIVGPFDQPFTVLPGPAPPSPLPTPSSSGQGLVWVPWSLMIVAAAVLVWLAVRSLRTHRPR